MRFHVQHKFGIIMNVNDVTVSGIVNMGGALGNSVQTVERLDSKRGNAKCLHLIEGNAKCRHLKN